jgi:hypothetical protein
MIVNCPKCNREIVEANIEEKKAYCSSCMEWFSLNKDSVENSSNKIAKDNIIAYMPAYVGDKYDNYYKNIWYDKYDKNIFFSFNIFAFLFPFLWMLYRKMYIEFAIFYMASQVLSLILPRIITLVNLEARIILLCALIIPLSFNIFMGFVGNYLYMKNSKRYLLKMVNNKAINILENLKSRKCTNKKIVIAIIVIGGLLSIFVFIICFVWKNNIFYYLTYLLFAVIFTSLGIN